MNPSIEQQDTIAKKKVIENCSIISKPTRIGNKTTTNYQNHSNNLTKISQNKQRINQHCEGKIEADKDVTRS